MASLKATRATVKGRPATPRQTQRCRRLKRRCESTHPAPKLMTALAQCALLRLFQDACFHAQRTAGKAARPAGSHGVALSLPADVGNRRCGDQSLWNCNSIESRGLIPAGCDLRQPGAKAVTANRFVLYNWA